MEIICFKMPDEENGYLSNWYMSDFVVDDIKFTSLEQYMMYEKARYFHDEKTAGLILKTDDPSEIKALGRKVSNFDNVYWNGIRQIVVFKGLCAKFSQNPDLKDKLKSTGDAILVECSLKDTIWANGISIDDEDRFDVSKWKGQNLLGYSLMMVREIL